MGRSGQNQIPIGAADARAAIEYVRKHATEYNLAIDQIGIIGFSAGGTITATSAMGYDRNNRPDFVAPVLPVFFPIQCKKQFLPDAPPYGSCWRQRMIKVALIYTVLVCINIGL